MKNKSTIATILGAGLLGLAKVKSSGSFVMSKGYEPKTPTSLENFCKRKSKAATITSLKISGYFGSYSNRKGFKIPSNISNMVNLKSLEIRSLDHTSVSIPDLSGLENLEQIMILNPWQSVEKHIVDQILINASKAPNLKKIVINSANIESLPSEFCSNLKKAHAIYLNANRLSSLPSSFSQIGSDQERLLSVSLSGNDFTQIPQVLADMSEHLKTLKFTNMMADQFPSLERNRKTFYSGFEINDARIKFSHFGNANDADPPPLRLSQINYRFDLLAPFHIEKVVLGNLIVDKTLIEQISVLKPFTDLKCIGCKIDSYSDLQFLPSSIKTLHISSLRDMTLDKPYDSNLFSYITHLKDLEDIEFSCDDGDYIHSDIVNFPRLSRIRVHMIGYRSKLSYPDASTLSMWYLQGKLNPDVLSVIKTKINNAPKSQLRRF